MSTEDYELFRVEVTVVVDCYKQKSNQNISESDIKSEIERELTHYVDGRYNFFSEMFQQGFINAVKKAFSNACFNFWQRAYDSQKIKMTNAQLKKRNRSVDELSSLFSFPPDAKMDVLKVSVSKFEQLKVQALLREPDSKLSNILSVYAFQLNRSGKRRT